jgi:5-oxoprolinase (ATP-hydrolysing)
MIAVAADGSEHPVLHAYGTNDCCVATIPWASQSAGQNSPGGVDSPAETDSTCFDLKSGEEAPVLAARLMSGTPPGMSLGALELRVGTTRGTNALLEGNTDPVAAFVNEGLEGLFAIGTQQRLGLFDLVPRLPPTVVREVFSVRGRRGADGSVTVPLDEAHVRSEARRARAAGFRHAAVALLHAPRASHDELQVASILREEGFERIATGSAVASIPILLARGQTAAVDAALSSAVHGLFARIAAALPRAQMYAASSAGGVSDIAHYRPKDSLLSGPAMGCAAARTALALAGLEQAITFDMGGTSTDVARVDRSGIAMRGTSTVSGITIASTAIDVHSVAAGGGSICRATVDGLFVGPESAGAHPGPACYGRGGPLTVTDVNLLLGRLPERMASLPLHRAAAEQAADREAMSSGRDRTTMLHEFLALANEHMASAVRAVTEVQGYDPRAFTLAVFGGAGGQHGCAVAEALGIAKVVVLPHAGFVSGEGALTAPRQAIATVPFRAALGDGRALRAALQEVTVTAHHDLKDAGNAACLTRATAVVRSPGQAGTIDVELPIDGGEFTAADIRARFVDRFRAMFGRDPGSADPEVEEVRAVVAVVPPIGVMDDAVRTVLKVDGAGATDEKRLLPGVVVDGPALIVEPGATIAIDPGWQASTDTSGVLHIGRMATVTGTTVLPVDVVAARCTAIASWMAAILSRSARSVNIKDRLDFSCGILTADGKLCANAPNVPVHLGALGACVRSIAALRAIEPGEVLLTNHPAFGGSHLPDITVVRAVHDDAGRRIAYVAARAHHAEIGGIRPGSMPPDARTLAEEGVVFPPMRVALGGALGGALDEDALRHALANAPYPSRDPDLNCDDVRAAIAALDAGATAFAGLARAIGSDALTAAIDALLARSATRTRCTAARVPVIGLARTELLDDGTPICVRIDRTPNGLRIDFTGSGSVHSGNLNAPIAVVRSAVLYALRVLAGMDEALDEHRAPLNEGFLEPVELVIPRGLLNPEFHADPTRCPAVFAGNTETSQRVVDAVLGAFGVAAASQGTMNNVVIASQDFSIFETLGGGAGAISTAAGTDAVHVHMTNTRLTDPETMELRSPVVLERLAIRHGSGGIGAHDGGAGMIRRIRVLAPCDVCFAAQRRAHGPSGIAGGGDGLPGLQRILRADGSTVELLGICTAHLEPGDAFEVETPGGGAWGSAVARS